MTVEVGNIILATGYDLFDARRMTQYGYGRLANVFTSLEFERLSNAAGPTGGNIVLRDGKTTQRLSASSTASARATRTYNDYCSAICCMQSLSSPTWFMNRTGAKSTTSISTCARQARATMSFTSACWRKARCFVRGKVAEVTERPAYPMKKGNLIIQVEDTLIGKQRRIPVDMVILSAGLQPRA